MWSLLDLVLRGNGLELVEMPNWDQMREDECGHLRMEVFPARQFKPRLAKRSVLLCNRLRTRWSTFRPTSCSKRWCASVLVIHVTV